MTNETDKSENFEYDSDGTQCPRLGGIVYYSTTCARCRHRRQCAVFRQRGGGV